MKGVLLTWLALMCLLPCIITQETDDAFARADEPLQENISDESEERKYVHDARAVKNDLSKMPAEAVQALLDAKGPDTLKEIKKITPLYREDLASDYEAYYEVVYEKEYYIISAGPKTGDYDVINHADRPEPTAVVRRAAKKRGAKCVKYYVMAPSADLMCADEDGKFVASSVPDYALNFGEEEKDQRRETEEEKPIDADAFNKYILSKANEEANDWRQHAAHVLHDIHKEENEGEDKQSDRKRKSRDRKKSFRAQEISPGSAVSVATGPVESLEVRVRSMIPNINEQRKPGREDHLKLCEVVSGCDKATVNGRYAVLSSEHAAQYDAFVVLELLPETQEKYNSTEFIFALDIVGGNGSVTTHYYGVLYGPSKRWSSWTIRWIRGASYFPKYKQFKSGSCQVGCGAVAWAMVFGFYDRRSHYSSIWSHSKNLYRSSWDGTYGDWRTIAPKYNDGRMMNYIKHIKGILGTFCLGGQGATWWGKMDNVAGFFKAREYGRPYIRDKYHIIWTNVARYTDHVGDWVRDRLKSDIPVIIGWRSGSYFKWHYPVAIGLAWRTKRTRNCYWIFGCTAWKTEYQYAMYLNQGWGGSGNGWFYLNAWYGIIAGS